MKDAQTAEFFLKGLERHGIEKRQFGHDFVYRYPESAKMPVLSPTELKRELQGMDFTGQEMAFYLHVPFCTSICSYCHYFKQLATRQETEGYMKAAAAEIGNYRKLAKGKIELNSIFFGGGTPTILGEKQLAGLLGRLAEEFELSLEKEISIESSPETLSEEKLFGLREAGFNRLSIGVQDFNDEVTRRCNRNHDRKQAVEAFDTARAAGFENINIDLIYGLPGQEKKHWGENMEKIEGVRPESVTASDLRVLPGTALYSAGREKFPKIRELLEMYSMFCEKMLSMNYIQQFPYQFVKRGKEMQFLELQWGSGSFIGIGPSSCSYIAGWDYNNAFPMENYTEAVAENGLGAAVGKKLSGKEEMVRFAALALKKSGANRENPGIGKGEFRKRFGVELEQAFKGQIEKLEKLELVESNAKSISLTGKGMFFHDEIAKQLFKG